MKPTININCHFFVFQFWYMNIPLNTCKTRQQSINSHIIWCFSSATSFLGTQSKRRKKNFFSRNHCQKNFFALFTLDDQDKENISRCVWGGVAKATGGIQTDVKWIETRRNGFGKQQDEFIKQRSEILRKIPCRCGRRKFDCTRGNSQSTRSFEMWFVLNPIWRFGCFWKPFELHTQNKVPKLF